MKLITTEKSFIVWIEKSFNWIINQLLIATIHVFLICVNNFVFQIRNAYISVLVNDQVIKTK